MNNRLSGLAQLDQRTREIFKQLVENYLDTGEPVGSRYLSQAMPLSLSPASVRNVMSDLETAGLIFAPHISAGRLPTELGLRMFVDGLLQVGDLTSDERQQIEAQIAASNADRNVEDVLTDAGSLLSGLSHCAGVVLTSKSNVRLKHLEFVPLDPQRAMVILVGDDGSVENRIIKVPAGIPPSSFVEATNYINARIAGKNITQLTTSIQNELETQKNVLDDLTARVVEAGLATWSGQNDEDNKTLIVRGRSNLLEDDAAMEDLERIRVLFDDFEKKKDLIQLLGLAQNGDGVRIFIGSENNLFSLSGSSLVVAPYRDKSHNIIGVLGVIGPTRLNYARIIPMVDYTAQVVGRILT